MTYGEVDLKKVRNNFGLQICESHLDLWKPEGHLHDTVECHSRGQLGTGLLRLARLGIERAEAQVGVGVQWTHGEGLGQGERLAVEGCGQCDLWESPITRNITEEPQSIRLPALLLLSPGRLKGLLAELSGFCHATGQHIDLA